MFSNRKKPLLKNSLLASAIATVSIPYSVVADDLSFLLEEIVVTAQRKEKSIYDTPVAVSAYSAEALASAGVDDISDFNAANPSFMATPFLSDPLGNAPVRIRGIGTGGGNPGFEGAVGLYVDEVYRSRTGSALLTFFDMDAVEILRGPQGTLFGKNTTAGALLQRTAGPVIGENSASMKVGVGTYGETKVEGVVNVASSDTSAFRIAGLYEELDGWFENAATGENTFWRKNKALRGSFKLEPSEELSVKVIADWSSMLSPGNYGTSTRLLDNVDTSGDHYAGRQLFFERLAEDTSSGGLGVWYNDPSFDPKTNNIRNSRNGEYELEQKGVTAHVNYELSDNMSLRSITGWRNIESQSLFGDWDFSPTAIGGSLDQIYDFDTFSQEFILEGDLELDNGQSIEFVTGVNYYTEEIDYQRVASVGSQFANWIAFAGNSATFVPGDPTTAGSLGDLEDLLEAGDIDEATFAGTLTAIAGAFPTNLAQILAGTPSDITFLGNPDFDFQDMNFNQQEDSYGIFGHITYDMTEELSLVLGARYNRVDKDFDLDNRFPFNPALPETAQQQYHDAATANIFGFYAAGAALMSPDYSDSRTDEELTYNASLQYRPNDGLQFYASYSRGFKSGGFNLNEDAVDGVPCLGCIDDGTGRTFNALNPSKAEFDPEYVDAYEIGARWQINGRTRVSATAFYSDYDDLQVATFTGLTFVVVNAGSSTSEGIELEGEFAATENLILTAGATFMKAEYGDDVVGLPAGRRRGQTPDEAFVLGARYTQPLDGDVEFYANGNFSYQGDMFLAEGVTGSPLSQAKQDAYSLFGATVGLRVLEDWDLNIYCSNCFNENYYEWAFNQPFHNALMANPAPPRTWGMSFKKELL